MASRCGAIRGACASTVRSALATRKPRARSIASTCVTNSALGALPARVGVAEVLADVPEPGGAQQRIAQRVQQHVAVGMRHDAVAVGNAHAAEHDEVPGPEGVYVRTEADAHVPAVPPKLAAPRLQDRGGQAELGGVGDLEVGRRLPAMSSGRSPSHSSACASSLG